MTPKEAECFRALQRWRRCHLSQNFKKAFTPKAPLSQAYKTANGFNKFIINLIYLVFLPLLVLFWLLNILRGVVTYPILILLTRITPRDIRAPGERNIKGVHYQFAQHTQLPPELYVRCVDDWVRILYGADKLPKYSLANYLDADYLVRRRVAYADDQTLHSLVKKQISNAREDLSRDLGHY